MEKTDTDRGGETGTGTENRNAAEIDAAKDEVVADGAAVERAEGEALVDTLFEEGVLVSDTRTDAVTTSAEFEDTYAVYLDTYTSVTMAEFVDTVAEVFGIDGANAADRIDELDVTREQLAAFLSLRSALEGSYDVGTLSRMAVVVAGLEPETPVPERLERVDDDTYEGFLATHDRAIVTVWARRCDPCEAMKGDLDAVLAAVPDGIGVAGIDGDTEGEFCTGHDVDAAPAMVLFENGSHRRTVVGRTFPDQVETIVENVYG